MSGLGTEVSISAVEEEVFDDFLIIIEVVRVLTDAHHCDVERRLAKIVLSIDICS